MHNIFKVAVASLFLVSSSMVTISSGAMEIKAVSMADEQSCLEVFVGQKQDEFQYKIEEGCIIGPNDFEVHDNIISILDSVGRRILLFDNNEWLYNIDLDNVSGICTAMEYYEGIYYILDDNYMINLYTEQGEFIGVFDSTKRLGELAVWLSKDHEGVYAITVENNRYYISLGEVYDILEKREEEYQIDENNFKKLPGTTSEIYVDCLLQQEDNAFYLTNEVCNTVTLCQEVSVYKVDGNGDVIGAKILDNDGSFYYPTEIVQIGNDSDIYFMKCYKNKLTIEKIVLEDTLEKSKLPEKYTKCLETKDIEAFNEMAVADTPPLYSIVTRENAFSTANAFISSPWTLSLENQKTRSNVIVPSYISSVNLSGGATKTMYGVPYCWGGYMSVSEFKNKIKAGYTAGNVNTDRQYGYQAYTAGVDCSGLVSVVYGLSPKKSTSDFAYAGNQSTTWNGICRMDYLVIPGKHVMLFCTRVNATTVLVIDASTYTNKVSNRAVNQSELIQQGYQLFRGWASGHSYTGSWKYDAQYHYQTCAYGCCNDSASTRYGHSWIVSGSKKTCRVCGYSTSN